MCADSYKADPFLACSQDFLVSCCRKTCNKCSLKPKNFVFGSNTNSNSGDQTSNQKFRLCTDQGRGPSKGSCTYEVPTNKDKCIMNHNGCAYCSDITSDKCDACIAGFDLDGSGKCSTK